MKVNIAVHGRWHAFELANGLQRRGAMGRLFTTYPAVVARRFVTSDIEIHTRPLLELRRRLYDRWRLGSKPDLVIAKAFARYAARTATHDADILVGWSSATLEAIAPAQAAGMKVVLERGSTHIRNQIRVLRAAYAEFGLAYRDTEDEIVRREVAEYAAADAIAVASEYAADTFVAEGISRAKLIVNPYGVDLSRFTPSVRAVESAPVRILFAGRIGIRKGVPWLVKAFAEIGPRAELHLVGPVDPEASAVLVRCSANVVIRGALSIDQLAQEYAIADIFCQPSLEEGGVPLTLLQAMASGLPSIVTPAAQGPVRDGVHGIVVADQSAEDLTRAIERLISDPDERLSMGRAARASVAEGFGWQDYADRALDAYGRLLGGGAVA